MTHYLLEALSLAQQRRGFCAPNPAVGAVVVKAGRVVASGSHWAAGQPHAEAMAFRDLSPEQAAGSTVYVTLEPCCHLGRTPPCVELLIQRNVKEVIYSYQDPNPLVAGKGEQALKKAGIPCHRVPMPEIDAFYQSYHYWTMYRRPWVTAKIALSLDGKIAGEKGQRIAITGPELQVITHQWRKRSDAILTTAQTIIHDDPQLNVRLQGEVWFKPVYVLDRNLSIPTDARVFDSSSKITLFYQEGLNSPNLTALIARGAHCISVPVKQNRLDLGAVLQQIGQDGVHDLWVEAGGACFEALIMENLVQRALLYIALKVLGPSAQAGFTQAFDFRQNKQAVDWRQVGQDMLCEVNFSGTINP